MLKQKYVEKIVFKERFGQLVVLEVDLEDIIFILIYNGNQMIKVKNYFFMIVLVFYKIEIILKVISVVLF